MSRSLLSTVSVRVCVGTVLVSVLCLAQSPVREPLRWGEYLATALVCGWGVGWWVARILRRDLRPINDLCAADADPAEPLPPMDVRELEDVGTTVRGSLKRLEQVLRASVGAQQELEAMLDSMQDAVVAVDAAGRIQWTNQRMQRLVPSASFSATIRVGHALVQAVRDPDVLECVRASLTFRQVSERRSISLIPGRIFEVSALF